MNTMQRLQNSLATLLVAGFATVTTGCTDAETSVFIQRVISPDVSETGCVFAADGDGLGRINGEIDLNYTDDYKAVLAVGNQLVSRGDEDTLRAESNRVQFYEAEVEVFSFDGTLLSSFSVASTGFADPGAGGNPSYGAVSANLFNTEAADQFRSGAQPLNQTVVSRVIVHGVTLGGTDVQTAPWDFPIEVYLSSNCYNPPTAPTCEDDPEPVCYLGQDSGPITDCRTVDRQRNLVPPLSLCSE